MRRRLVLQHHVSVFLFALVGLPTLLHEVDMLVFGSGVFDSLQNPRSQTGPHFVLL